MALVVAGNWRYAWRERPCVCMFVMPTNTRHASRGSWGSSARCRRTSFCEMGSSEWWNVHWELQPVEATVQLVRACLMAWQWPRTTTVYTSTIWHWAQADRPARRRSTGLQTAAFGIRRKKLVIEVLSVYCFCYKTTCPHEERKKWGCTVGFSCLTSQASAKRRYISLVDSSTLNRLFKVSSQPMSNSHRTSS